MVLLTRSDVPLYLQNSAFFTSLDENDQIEFEVPDDCFKLNEQIESTKDLHHLLKTTSFWGVDDVEVMVAPFILQSAFDCTSVTDLGDGFPEYQRILTNFQLVKEVKPNCAILQAIYTGFGVSIVKYLYEHGGCTLSADVCEASVRMRDLPMLAYLHKQHCPWDERTTLAAINSNNMDILQFVCANGCPLPQHAMFQAALVGSVDAMIYLHDVMAVPYPEVLWLNLYNLPAIQHLRSVGCDWNVCCCEEYAFQGKLECLKYAHENGSIWDRKVCTAAARHGHLACLIYLHEQGCPWSGLTMIDAAQYGQLECLKYAHTHGCPVSFLAPNQACAYGQWRCLSYILWHCSILTSFAIYALLVYVVLIAAWLQVMIRKGSDNTIHDYAQLGSILCWFMQFVLLVYGPRWLLCDTTLQLQLHFALLGLMLVVMTVMLATGPLFASNAL